MENLSNLIDDDSSTACNTNYYGCVHFYLFYTFYQSWIHRPLVITICLFGSIANFLNLAVLSRRVMRTSPINILLGGLAFAQLGLLLNNLSLSIFELLAKEWCFLEFRSFAWITCMLLNVNLSLVFHTIALLHTVAIAIGRFIAIRLPTVARTMVTVENIRHVVLSIYVIVPFVCSPAYFSAHVVERPIDSLADDHCFENVSANGRRFYDVDYSSEILLSITTWTFGTIFKLVPCWVISVLSYGLIKSLKEVEERRRRMTKPIFGSRDFSLISSLRSSRTTEVVTETRSVSTSSAPLITKRDPKQQRQRLTKMLLVIVLLFVVVELPQGILNLLTGILGLPFAYEVYDHVADFFSMLTLLYSSLNFVLYCVMSAQFKGEFLKLFCSSTENNQVDGISNFVVSQPRRRDLVNRLPVIEANSALASSRECSASHVSLSVDGSRRSHDGLSSRSPSVDDTLHSGASAFLAPV